MNKQEALNQIAELWSKHRLTNGEVYDKLEEQALESFKELTKQAEKVANLLAEEFERTK